MAKTTITEALADIKTSLARIEKKRASIIAYLGRDARMRDPMEPEGGSREFVKRERQAIHDLQEKIVKVRTAIQAANLTVVLEIEGEKRVLSEWLNWRREISEGHQRHLEQLVQQLASLRQQAQRQGLQVKEVEGAAGQPGDLVVNISEAGLAKEIENMASVLGQLDGKLSLLNATTFIDV